MVWKRKNSKVSTIDHRRVVEIERKLRERALESKKTKRSITTNESRLGISKMKRFLLSSSPCHRVQRSTDIKS